MKKILLLLGLLFTCCVNNEMDLILDDSSDVITRSSGDGKYDLLGYGYDITGQFGALAHKARVIDVENLIQDDASIFEKNIYRVTSYDYTSESDLYELTRVLGIKSSYSEPVTAKNDEMKFMLGGSQLGENVSYSYTSLYSQTFATYSHLFAKVSLNADLARLTEYVSSQFLEDVNSMKPMDFILKYGTHVLANVHLGGALKMLYQSKATEAKSKQIHEAGFKFSVANIFSFNFGSDYTIENARKNTQQKMVVRSVGGEGSMDFTIRIDQNGDVDKTISASEWLRSINESTSVMIGADRDKVYPIYEFVPIGKRDVIKRAYEEYIQSKVFDIVNTAIPIPVRQVNGLGNDNQGGGVVIKDIDKNGQPDLILMGNDDNTPNRFWYWVIFNTDADGMNGRQSQRFWVSKTVSDVDRGAAIAIGDIDKNGMDDLVFMALDDNKGTLSFRYVIGWDLNVDGSCRYFSDKVIIPTNMGRKADGAGIALYDINGNGILDMILMQYDAPSGGPNQFRYKIYYDLSSDGKSWTGTSVNYYVPTTFGRTADGAGVTVGNIDTDPRPDIILTAYDDPDGANNFRYMVLHNVDKSGNPVSVTPYFTYKGCGNHGAGADGQLCDIDGNGIPDLFFMCIDDATPNSFRYIIGHDLNSDGALSYIR